MGEQDGTAGLGSRMGTAGWRTRMATAGWRTWMEDQDRDCARIRRGMLGRPRRGGPFSPSYSPIPAPSQGSPGHGGHTEGRCPSPAPGPHRPVPPPSRARSPRGCGRVPVSPPASRPLTMSARPGRHGHGRHAAGGPGLTSEPPHRVTQRRRHDVTAGDPPTPPTPRNPRGRGSAMGGTHRQSPVSPV